MSSKMTLQRQTGVVLQMVLTLVIAILLGQLWLFTVTLDAMENREASMTIAVSALMGSMLAATAVVTLIRFFFRTESRNPVLEADARHIRRN